MDDFISRQAAIEAAIEAVNEWFGAYSTVRADMIAEAINNTVPAAQPEQRWIPVSERLPEDGRQVLVYARSVHYALGKYDEMREADGTYKKQWVTFDAWKPFYTIKDVIAWMPLPSPYQKEGEE